MNYTAGYLVDRERIHAPLAESGLSVLNDYTLFYDKYSEKYKGSKQKKYVHFLQAYEQEIQKECTICVEIIEEDKLQLRLTQELQKQLQDLQICGYQLPITNKQEYDIKRISDAMILKNTTQDILKSLMDIEYRKEGGKPTFNLRRKTVDANNFEKIANAYEKLLQGYPTKYTKKVHMKIRIYDGVYEKEYADEQANKRYELCTYLLNYKPKGTSYELTDNLYIAEDNLSKEKKKQEQEKAFQQYKEKLEKSPYAMLPLHDGIIYTSPSKQDYCFSLKSYGSYEDKVNEQLYEYNKEEFLAGYEEYIENIDAPEEEKALLYEIIEIIR